MLMRVNSRNIRSKIWDKSIENTVKNFILRVFHQTELSDACKILERCTFELGYKH